jgi:hypothetical protein
MTMFESIAPETAALGATVLAVAASVPQLRRVIASHDVRGVSITTPVLGVGTELAWAAYAGAAELWSALPEALLMVVGNAALAVALARRGVRLRSALAAGLAWVAVLAAVTACAGLLGLAVALALGYAVQITPAVWTAWRTTSPTGIAASTWALVGAEGVLWAAYGIHHRDVATAGFAAIAITAAALTLVRKATAAVER